MLGFRLNLKDGVNTFSSLFCLDSLLEWVELLATNYFIRKNQLTKYLEHGATLNSCIHTSSTSTLKVTTRHLEHQLIQPLQIKTNHYFNLSHNQWSVLILMYGIWRQRELKNCSVKTPHSHSLFLTTRWPGILFSIQVWCFLFTWFLAGLQLNFNVLTLSQECFTLKL